MGCGMSIMYCKNCGSEIEFKGAKRCEKCGMGIIQKINNNPIPVKSNEYYPMRAKHNVIDQEPSSLLRFIIIAVIASLTVIIADVIIFFSLASRDLEARIMYMGKFDK